MDLVNHVIHQINMKTKDFLYNDIINTKEIESSKYYIIINEHHCVKSNRRECITTTYDNFSDAYKRCQKEHEKFGKVIERLNDTFEILDIKEETLYSVMGFKTTCILKNNIQYVFISKVVEIEDSI